MNDFYEDLLWAFEFLGILTILGSLAFGIWKLVDWLG